MKNFANAFLLCPSSKFNHNNFMLIVSIMVGVVHNQYFVLDSRLKSLLEFLLSYLVRRVHLTPFYI